MNSEKNINAIEILEKHELAISQLYKAYAEKLPEHKEFWLNLASEEEEHARWVRCLLPKIDNGTVRFNENRFKIEAIKTSFNYIQKRVQEANEQSVLLGHALGIALDMEKAMIEKDFFKSFEGDAPELKQTLADLLDSTRKHRAKLETALAQNQG